MKIFLIFDIGGTFVKWSIIKSDGDMIKNGQFPSIGKEEGWLKLLKQIGLFIKQIEHEHPISAIGISTAGTIDSTTGQILGKTENIKNYECINIKKELSQFISVPIFVENDANAAILGEITNSNEVNNALMITIGTDIGGGIVIGKEIYKGSSNLAGEVGFQIINNKRWGEYYSTSGLLKLVNKKNNLNLTTHEILESNDPKIKRTLNYWYKGIANGIANLIVSFNFDSIIIGGGISESVFFDLQIIKKYINVFLKLSQFKNSYNLLKAKYGNKAAILGMLHVINKNLK